MYIVSSFSIMNDKLFLTFFMIFVANCNFTCPRSYVCTWGVLKCTLQVHQLAEEKTSRSFQAEIIVASTVAHRCQYTHKIEYRNQSQKRNSKLKTLVQIIKSQFKIVNSQFKIVNSQFKIVNSQFKIVNSQFKIVNSQFKIVNSQLSTHLPRPPVFRAQYGRTESFVSFVAAIVACFVHHAVTT